MVEQGLNFTVIEAPHPLDDDSPGAIEAYDARKDFYLARRVWLGWAPGTDWLHEAIEREFGEDHVWYEVRSQRNASHVGAFGETSTVVLILMGVAAFELARKFGGRLGELGAEDIYDWVRQLAKQRRQEKGLEWAEDESPDFSRWEFEDLSESVKTELADVMDIEPEQLELVDAERREHVVLLARYRDLRSEREYTAEVGRADVVFRRVGAPEPEVPKMQGSKRRFWRRSRTP